jgi:hypothetical protein
MFFEVLVEGESDVPVVEEILQRRFGLDPDTGFRVHPHQGKGNLPADPRARPDPRRRGLLDQLPAKLRGFGKAYDGLDCCIVVIVDADREDCKELKSSLLALHESIELPPPVVLFRIAVEETESWYLADADALRTAYPKAAISRIPPGPPDQVIGAWERLAEVFGRDPTRCTGADKKEWAEMIAPHLDLTSPASPSLGALITGIERVLSR